VESAVEIFGLIASWNALDASCRETLAASATLEAARGSGRAAHAGFFLEGVVSRGNALVVVCDSG
jgi:hypothetical protein